MDAGEEIGFHQHVSYRVDADDGRQQQQQQQVVVQDFRIQQEEGNRHDNDEQKQSANYNNNKSTSKVSDLKWEEMFNRLLTYKKEYGNCLVPNRYMADDKLGTWVSTQRRHYKTMHSGTGESTPMTPERARRLEEIGFQWTTRDPRQVPWEYRYQELVQFKEKYGHSQVPIGWEENKKLSHWVSTQRQEYKNMQKGKQTRLTQERIQMLNRIDFVWEAQRGGPRKSRRATVAVPDKANPVDFSRVDNVQRQSQFNQWQGMSAQPPRPFGSYFPHNQIGFPMDSPINRQGGHQGFPNLLNQQSPQSPLQGNNNNNNNNGPWQMMSHGAFQQALSPSANLPSGMNPTSFPMMPQWSGGNPHTGSCTMTPPPHPPYQGPAGAMMPQLNNNSGRLSTSGQDTNNNNNSNQVGVPIIHSRITSSNEFNHGGEVHDGKISNDDTPLNRHPA